MLFWVTLAPLQTRQRDHEEVLSISDNNWLLADL
jgi:hypothetical protein